MRITLIIISNMLSFFCIAQETYPPITASKQIDSIYVRLHYDLQKNDVQAVDHSVAAITAILAPFQNEFPLFCGINQLHQAYYATDAPSRQSFMGTALKNLSNADTGLANRFSAQFFWLIEGFNLDKRMEEWMPADRMFRKALSGGKDDRSAKYSVTDYANKKLSDKNYSLVDDLARYDEIYFSYLKSKAPYDRLTLVFSKWLQIKQRLEQWLDLSYEDRSLTTIATASGQIFPTFIRNTPEYEALFKYNFKEAFDILFENMKSLKQELVTNNTRLSPNYNEGYRSSYFYLYNLFIQNFYQWAVAEHKISEAILPVKLFLNEDVLEAELKDAKQSGKAPVVSLSDLKSLIKNLSVLYYHTGIAAHATEVLKKGQLAIEEYPNITEDEHLNALVELAPYSIRAARLDGDFSRSYGLNRILKNITKKPDSLSITRLNQLEWYGEARVEEVFSLMEQQKTDEAIDSLSILIDEVATLPTTNEELIYSTVLWTNLQYLTALIKAQRGQWNTVLIKEMIFDLLQNKMVTSEIFYPGQLLAVKAIWREEKRIGYNYLKNLLFFTERQLQNNFILLSAEERMQLYARKMNDYFDVYHELLFSGALDSFPDIKQSVLSQSLYLKNALADGNVIPDEVFIGKGNSMDLEFLNQIRVLKQEVQRSNLNSKLHGYKTSASELNDRMQYMWLNAMEGPGKDALVKMKDWKDISGKIKTGQIYFETVRYKRWLSDSAVMYGFYLIDQDKHIVAQNLCTEKDLIRLLNQQGSSPQTSSLSATAKRGNELLGKADKHAKTFKPGDKDLLGELLLKPIWPYLQGKSELLMVHDGMLNRISFAALQWNKKYLIEQKQLQLLSGSNQLFSVTELPKQGDSVLLVGGLQYAERTNGNNNRLFKPEVNWQYLPGTKKETEELQPIFKKQGFYTKMISDSEFVDSLGDQLGKYRFVHLATHGFYYDSINAGKLFDDRYNRDAMAQEPLFRSGLAISAANNPTDSDESGIKGYLMGYELANTDLRNCYLVSLSACETGLGDLRNNLGVDGLSRALKIAGAKHLLISLWKVPDEPTAVFMQSFYTQLFSGKTPAAALQITQLHLSKTYPASAWAAFILVE